MECNGRFIKNYMIITSIFTLILIITLASSILLFGGNLEIPLLPKESKPLAVAKLLGIEAVLEEYGFARDLCIDGVKIEKPVSYYVIDINSGAYFLGISDSVLKTSKGQSYTPVNLSDLIFNVDNVKTLCGTNIENARLFIPLHSRVKPLEANGRIVVAFPINTSEIGKYTVEVFMRGDLNMLLSIDFMGNRVLKFSLEFLESQP